MRKFVICRTCIDGFHCWKNAPVEFDFLKNRHHHVFNVIAQFEVTDNDREIEFVVKASEIKNYLISKYAVNGMCEFGGKSCEDIAEELVKRFGMAGCEVNEDGFGGATCIA